MSRASSEQVPLPPGLAAIAQEFADLAKKDRLQLLLEFSDGLPPLPDRLADHPELLEPVPECQSPIFLATEVVPAAPDGRVSLFFSAPPEAPTTRGFAGILHEGLNGTDVAEVLATPADLPLRLSLTDSVSPLRLRGMNGMLARIQRQVRERS